MTKLNFKKELAVLFIAVSSHSFAQQTKIVCGNDILMNQLENQYPGYKQSVNNTFEQAIHSQSIQNRASNTNNVINVVVHVVWRDSVENIADSVILSQIQVLNEDYNKLNPDTGKLRNIFKPIAGSANITFNLYQTIRTKTTVLFSPSFSGIPNEMKYANKGGSDAVDPDHFLNIWVCKLQPIMLGGTPLGQVLGFAYPPNNLSNWPANQGAPTAGDDGVVIDFRCFGRNNPNPISADGTNILDIRGRTPVHEVGHYLGLRHIWGDGGSPFGGGNNCQGEDGIADTPKANDQSQFDCDTARNTCVDTNLPWTTANAPDMVENYMDYSAETCMNVFTVGQATLMNSILQGSRNGLISNTTALKKGNRTELAISLYPNPAKEQFVISSEFGQTIIKLELYDLLGNSVKILNPNTSSLIVPTDNLKNGIYLVKLSTASTSKIVRVNISK